MKKINVMPTKQEILNNLNGYQIDQLVEFIRQGMLTKEEVMGEPTFPKKSRTLLEKALAALADNRDSEPEELPPSVPQPDTKNDDDDEKEWKKACAADTPEAYLAYVEFTVGKGKHQKDAESALARLKRLKEKEESSQPSPQPSSPPQPQNPTQPQKGRKWGKNDHQKLLESLQKRPMPSVAESVNMVKDYIEKNPEENTKEIIDDLKANPNLLSADAVKQLNDDGLLGDAVLEEVFGVEFLAAMENGLKAQSGSIDRDIDLKITNPCTEVYFWGISTSGKSCLFAALLSVASTGHYGTWYSRDCRAKDYMYKLSNLFKENEVRPVAPGTPVGDIYDMSFDFVKDEESKRLFGKTKKSTKHHHPITFIDIAGGMLNLIYRNRTNPKSITQEDNGKLDELKNLINANRGGKRGNRKMHFFILEYGAHDYESNEKATQNNLLLETLDYLEKEGILKKDTDAVYLIVTKADRTNTENPEERVEILDAYFDKHYKNFKDKLLQICGTNEISTAIIPFTIGEVKMQDFCKFNPKPAANILDKIVERTFSIDKSKFGKFTDKMGE